MYRGSLQGSKQHVSLQFWVDLPAWKRDCRHGNAWEVFGPLGTSQDQQGEIHFAESAWTYPVVIGLAKMGPADIAFAVLLLVVNLCGMALEMVWE